jgi:DNA-binding MarR family transcriptional regulator
MSPRPAFDEIIHAPNRLRICAVLAAVTEAEFRTLRESLGVADPVVSKHLKVLQDAGYVALTKPTGSGRVRTWARLTPTGRRAFHAHVAELQRLASPATPTSLASPTEGQTTTQAMGLRSSQRAPARSVPTPAL